MIVQGAKEPWSKKPGVVTEGGLGLGEGSRRMASGLEVVELLSERNGNRVN